MKKCLNNKDVNFNAISHLSHEKLKFVPMFHVKHNNNLQAILNKRFAAIDEYNIARL